MDRRTAPEIVASAVSETMTKTNVSVRTLSEATGIGESALRDHLSNRSEFTLGELTAVGGFFHVPASQFFEGVAA